MGFTEESTAGTKTSTPALSTAVTTAGFATLVIGQVVFTAGLHVQLGATRSESYFGPGLLLGNGASGHVALLAGALISLVGLSVAIAGVYQLARRLDAAARALESRRSTNSARYVAGGLLAVGFAYALYEVGIVLIWREMSRTLGTASLFVNRSTMDIPGLVIGLVGVGLVLLGTHHVLTNIQVITDAARDSSRSNPR